MAQRKLSKSAFKLGSECGRKLAYYVHGYPSQKQDDPYLEFLADGGFMVEALARARYAGGIEVVPSAGESPAEATVRLLKSASKITLFEAVFETSNQSSRVDIIERVGNRLNLIEVKAKSTSEDADLEGQGFRTKAGTIRADWRPYLDDVTFQREVIRQVMGPSFQVIPHLLLVSKSHVCDDAVTFDKVELLPRDPTAFGKPRARYLADPKLVADHPILKLVDVTAEADLITMSGEFAARVDALTDIARCDSPSDVAFTLSKICRDCEYRITDGRKSGFRECWGKRGDADPHILDLYRVDSLGGKDSGTLESLIKRGVTGVNQIPLSALKDKGAIPKRQALQIAGQEHVDLRLLRALDAAVYPLHFIDFETSSIALPYHAGMRPYGRIAFQFSCHTISKRGADPVHTEWINLTDACPNTEFVQQLREAIGNTGTIMVWSPHERSILNHLSDEMEVSKSTLAADLSPWIADAVRPADEGGRMLDLHALCRSYYFHPKMKGRTSIKVVLPAVWDTGTFLHTDPWFVKYFKDSSGGVLTPYETLESRLVDGLEIAAVTEGGAAMAAYQDMMYGYHRTNLAYRTAIRESLLRYCELDTAAMLMIWKYWLRT